MAIGDDEAVPVRGIKRWPLIHSGRDVTAFGRFAGTNEFHLELTEYRAGHFTGLAANACLSSIKQVEGGKATWALEHKITNDVPIKMSDLMKDQIFRDYPNCYSGGIYIPGRLKENAVRDMGIC